MNADRENERNIQRDNRRYAVRFAAIVLLSAVVGGVFGYCSNGVLPQDVRAALDAGADALTRNAPWLLVGTLLLGAAICLTLVLRARAALKRWDGEDERACNAIENRLNWVICVSNLMMVLAMLLFALGIMAMHQMSHIAALIGFLSFMLSLVGAILFQQQAMDLSRVINPEKAVSVYDPRFQKKLLSLCDERERQQIGQASYAAFRAINVLCPALWLLLMIGNLLSDGWLGVAPAIVVAILWGTASTVYAISAIRLERMK